MSRKPARVPFTTFSEDQHWSCYCSTDDCFDCFSDHTKHRVSRNWHDLQEAEEFSVVLITFSFGYQAVQLIDQLSFHLDEKFQTGYKSAARVHDEFQMLRGLEEHFISHAQEPSHFCA